MASASKALRNGRVFIDHLRNGRGATRVASWSLRARPGATVAVPLAWEELGRLSGADAFDIGNVPRRIARLKRDPGDGIDQHSQDLSAVGKLLSGDRAEVGQGIRFAVCCPKRSADAAALTGAALTGAG